MSEFDPLDPETHDDPYPTYRWLRDNAPVYYNEHRGFWALSRFEDVHAAARAWDALSNADGVEVDDADVLVGKGAGNFLISDPPRHDQLRDVVRRRFSPKAVVELEGTIRDLVRTLLAEIRDVEIVDFARDVSLRLPMQTVSALLGFPPEDRPRLEAWFRDISSRTPGSTVVPPQAWEAVREYRDYVAAAVEDRRRNRTDDVLSVMVDAMEEGRMTASEIEGASTLLFGAAVMTTSGLLTNSMHHLGRRPELWRWLQERPDAVPGAIEEFLRYDTPAQWLGRTTTREYELHGQRIPAGEKVLLLYASANRDERRFPDAEALDLRRKPERHLAFGNGIHFCLGAPLARLETRVVYEEWLAQVEDFELAGPVERHFSPAERGLSRLPLRVRYAG
jgi:cytochrome P450